MQPLPKPPPYTPPSSLKATELSPLYPIFSPDQPTDQQSLTPETLKYAKKIRSREQPILRQPQRTKPIVWCAAIVCMLISLLIIFLGVAILIIYAVVQPRNPVFDTPAASLNAVYYNSPQFLNREITILANISNPNRKLSIIFEYLHIQLYFSESPMAAQVLQPFSQRPGEARSIPVHMLSSLVYLPPKLAVELQRLEQMNRVVYNLKATYRVKVKLGLLHYVYWLHGNCQLEMTGPPTSVLIAHSCRTKR